MDTQPTVFLMHGSWGNPDNIWFPWIRQELTGAGIHVITPKFPTPFGQQLDRWQKTFAPFLTQITPNTIIVAHSVAVPFVLHLLPQLPTSVRGCVFVSGFARPIRIRGKGISSFLAPFNWDAIRERGGRIELFNSDNDFIVPAICGQELAEQLGGTFHLVKGAGHFTPWTGYRRFPKLRDTILNMFGLQPSSDE